VLKSRIARIDDFPKFERASFTLDHFHHVLVVKIFEAQPDTTP
jgi:hypothetical protein